MINQKSLQEYFVYNHENGEFTLRHGVSKNNLKSRFPAGKKVGWRNNLGYITICFNGKKLLAHRLAWLYVHGILPDGDIDHINGNPSDNRIENLRCVSHKVNCQNKRSALKNNKTGFLGVSFNKSSGMYAASIKVNEKQIQKYFKNIDDAKNCYLEMKRKLHEGCTI